MAARIVRWLAQDLDCMKCGVSWWALLATGTLVVSVRAIVRGIPKSDEVDKALDQIHENMQASVHAASLRLLLSLVESSITGAPSIITTLLLVLCHASSDDWAAHYKRAVGR